MPSSEKVTRPSSPRHFFARLYGHLEEVKEEVNQTTFQDALISFSRPQTNQNNLPFLLPNVQDSHLTAVVAGGLSAFRK